MLLQKTKHEFRGALPAAIICVANRAAVIKFNLQLQIASLMRTFAVKTMVAAVVEVVAAAVAAAAAVVAAAAVAAVVAAEVQIWVI